MRQDVYKRQGYLYNDLYPLTGGEGLFFFPTGYKLSLIHIYGSRPDAAHDNPHARRRYDSAGSDRTMRRPPYFRQSAL